MHLPTKAHRFARLNQEQAASDNREYINSEGQVNKLVFRNVVDNDGGEESIIEETVYCDSQNCIEQNQDKFGTGFNEDDLERGKSYAA